MKKILVSLILSCLVAFSAQASQSITITAGDLLTSSSSAIPASSSLLLLLVQSGSGIFSNTLSANQFVVGDDTILAAASINNNGGGLGETVNPFANISGTPGDRLAIRWFSNFTFAQYQASATPGIGTFFGTFSGATTGTPNGGDPWLVPASGAVSLNFVTSSYANGGLSDALPNSAGVASNQIVPEPTTCALVGVGLVGLLAARKRRA